MQQNNYDALIHGEEQRFNKLEREEVVLRYIFASPPHYQKEHEDEELEETTQNFKPQIHYVVEQKATT
jgi:hypothetical protein